jgi:hypothetical protein
VIGKLKFYWTPLDIIKMLGFEKKLSNILEFILPFWNFKIFYESNKSVIYLEITWDIIYKFQYK